jgi:hypothetical protein
MTVIRGACCGMQFPADCQDDRPWRDLWRHLLDDHGMGIDEAIRRFSESRRVSG